MNHHNGDRAALPAIPEPISVHCCASNEGQLFLLGGYE